MATVQPDSASAPNRPDGREGIIDPSENDIYKTMTIISTAVNELARTLQQIREQLHGVSSACSLEHEKMRSSHSFDHFEIFAIAMKEVQLKSSRIERLEQENQALRVRLDESGNAKSSGEILTETDHSRHGNEISASRTSRLGNVGNSRVVGPQDASEIFSHSTPQPSTSHEGQVERLQSSDAPNSNGKRPLILPDVGCRNSAEDNRNPDSMQNTNVEANTTSNQRVCDVSENQEVEEVPESSNGLTSVPLTQDSQPDLNEGPAALEVLSEEPVRRPHPLTLRRGRRARLTIKKNHKIQKPQTSTIAISPTDAQPLLQDTSTKPTDDPPLTLQEPTLSNQANAKNALKRKGKLSKPSSSKVPSTTAIPDLAASEDKTLAVNAIQQTSPQSTRERPKRVRGRPPKGSVSERLRVEIITSTIPGPPTDDIHALEVTEQTANGEKNSGDAKEDAEEAERRRKEIAARELLVQAAMRREEADML
ncbi:hypothetical protein FQN49_005402 [Arthroderma sp. PD_2]|nr:hypothetical protein FQN49_005402 [Arthroderma sp. PD_2]